jgi:hypothetical protein
MTATQRQRLMFENAMVMFTTARNRVRYHSTAFSLIDAHRTLISLMVIAETEDELRRVQAAVLEFSDDLAEGIRRHNEQRHGWQRGELGGAA